MAEALGALGVASNIIQLIEFSSHVVVRINDYHSTVDEVPKNLAPIKENLELLVKTLNLINPAVSTGQMKQGTPEALAQVIEACQGQIQALNEVLSKILPTPGESSLRRMKKAFHSITYDSKIEKIQAAIRDHIQTLSLHFSIATYNSQTSQEKSLADTNRWLSPPDPTLNYQRALKLRQADTGLWFVDGEKFQNWMKDPSSRLWLHGIPGCGKTILSSTIIERVIQDCADDSGKAVAYFYFDFRDYQKQLAAPMLKSLILQIAGQLKGRSIALRNLHTSYPDEKRQPSLEALLQTLHDILLSIPETYIILDALDECSEHEDLFEILRTIANWQYLRMHIILTSRYDRDIEDSVHEFTDPIDIVKFERHKVDEDIRAYVIQRMQDDKGLRKWNDPELREEIEIALMNGAQGMFRWAVCQLDALSKCLNRSRLRKALNSLPPTLDATYERILCSIDEEQFNEAHRILRWIAFSNTPLSLEEVREVVALDPQQDPAFNPDDAFEDPMDVLSACSSLIVIRDEVEQDEDDTHESSSGDSGSDDNGSEGSGSEGSGSEGSGSEESDSEESDSEESGSEEKGSDDSDSNDNESNDDGSNDDETESLDDLGVAAGKVVVLAHYSVKEYLLSGRIQSEVARRYCLSSASSHSFLAQSCLKYLHQFSVPEKSYPEIIEEHKLARYCSKYWISHAQESEKDDANLNAQIVEFLTAQPQAYRNFIRISTAEPDLNSNLPVPSPYFYPSLAGLTEVVRLLIAKVPTDINTTNGPFPNALGAAAYQGQDAIAQLLLKNGANVNAQSGFYQYALCAASAKGHTTIVRMLLDNGANVNTQSAWSGTALFAASQEGHYNIVEMLLESGADINVKSEYWKRTAHVNDAGDEFHSTIYVISEPSYAMEALLQHHDTHIHLLSTGDLSAAYEGSLQSNNFIKIEVFVNNGRSRHDREGVKVTKLDLENGIEGYILPREDCLDDDMRDRIGRLVKDKSTTTPSDDWDNPSTIASMFSHSDATQALLDNDVELKLPWYSSTALDVASRKEHRNIVDLLLARGATGYFSSRKMGLSWGLAPAEETTSKMHLFRYINDPSNALESIRAYQGDAVDGLEFSYRDGTKDLLGGRGGAPGGTEFCLDPTDGVFIAEFNLRSGYWLDALQFVMSSGQKSDFFGQEDRGGPDTVKPPVGCRIVGLYGTVDGWITGLTVIFETEATSSPKSAIEDSV